MTGPVVDREWEAFLADSAKTYSSAARGDLLVTIPYSYGSPNADQRRALGDVISRGERVHLITSHAFVTNSQVLVAINSVITWLGNKPWTEKTFSDPNHAFRWLCSSATGLTAVDIARDIASVVPARYLWSKISEMK